MSLLRAGLRLIKTKPSIDAHIQKLVPEYNGYFEEMHRKPGIAFNEETEKRIIKTKLGELGITFNELAGGIIATIEGQKNDSGRVVALSADMDALPMSESASGKTVVSEFEGAAHMCGHDGHSTSLLLAAQYLHETKKFDGSVRLIWRPAEETGEGAKAMLEAGLLEQFPVDEIYGFHNFPNFPLGFGAVSEGPVLCGSKDFKITIKGMDGHAGWTDTPLEKQAVFAMSDFLNALSRDIGSFSSPFIKQGQSIKNGRALVSVSSMSSNSGLPNIISTEASCQGTIRALCDEDFESAIDRLHRLWNSSNGDKDKEFSLEITGVETPPLVNAGEPTKIAIAAMKDVFGYFAKVHDMPQVTGTDDFSFLSDKVPGCYFSLMGGDNDVNHPHSQKLHTAGYIFNPDLIPVAANVFTNIVERRLELPCP